MPDLSPILELQLTEQLRFILDLGAAVGAALLGGAIAVRLRQPAIVGYLVAGIVIGPFTPGFVGDVERISVLADVGVVLLLFALGVQFSIRELTEVRRVVLPAGALQILIVVVAGTAASMGLGLDIRAALVVGACLSVSSTLVLIKALLERGEIDSLHGRTAIGWSIVQDIATIVFIVALPPIAGADVVGPFALAIGKAAIFLVLAYLVGTRLLPWIFASVARLRSSELFLLAVFATALLTAFVSSAVFGLSLALGAFVAGILVSESDLSHQAAAEVIPFRDLFAVLFFVSIGMLVDPGALVAALPAVVVLVALAVGLKGGVIALLGRTRGLPARSAILVGAGLAQVGEFSFILAENGLDFGILQPAAYNLVLGTAVVSILISPIVWQVAERVVARVERRHDAHAVAAGPEPPIPGAPPTSRTELAFEPGEAERRPGVVVLGAGRVGRLVVQAVRNRGFRCVAVDRDPRRLAEVARMGAATIYGDAANQEILSRCGLDRTRVLVVAIGDPLTVRLATERARRINPNLTIDARARGRREADKLRGIGASRVADPEVEAAFELARHALQRMGVSGPELGAIVNGLRRDAYGRDRA
ncbi:MAG TPA: cation:proton antiporter [Candidatus Limnocylindrales bacterium]|nr:cation:proton antiporter [Candidatus Limnocylindrales bacterium]